MIDAKQAVERAKAIATDMLSSRPYKLEEIERNKYQGRDAWDITLSFPKSSDELSPLAALATSMGDMHRNYKRVLVDAETGEFMALKIRELASH